MAERHLTRRRTLQATGVAIASSLAGCGGGGGGDGDDGGDDESVEADVVITVGGEENHWDPAEAEASVGDVVAWQAESSGHFIIPESTPDETGWSGWTTSSLNSGDTRTFTFEVPGTYEYSCRYHSGEGVLTITGSSDSDGETGSGSETNSSES